MLSTIQKKLFALQDEKIRAFQIKLIPTIDSKTIIGTRTPSLRKLAKELHGTAEAKTFLQTLPHKYFDENQLHVFLISLIPDFDEAIAATENFLPHINNWATCDQLRPQKAFSKNLDKLLPHIKNWLKSKHAFTIRFAVEMLMTYFLDQNFLPKYLEMVAKIKSDEYYVNMMCAWYFATALAKQYNEAVIYIEQKNGKKLFPDVHNKTIRKACESFCISDEQKKYLRQFVLK